MRRAAVLCAALLAAASASADQTLMDNGPSAERLDLVFLGDGYTAAQQGLYRDDVQRFVAHLFSQPPFSTYKTLFNVHRVDLTSAQSGADDLCTGAAVDTALDAGFHPTGADCRLLFTYNGAKVYAAAARAPGYDPGAGLVVVIVNSAAYGGAASMGGYCVISRGPEGPESLAHEIGHSFGLLADEYVTAGRSYAGAEPAQRNVTASVSSVKWARWIAPGTALPTPGSAAGVPGLYEGAMGYQLKVYRPTFNSKMRTLHQPYDAVNAALLVERMDALLPPVVALAAPSPEVRSAGGGEVVVAARDGIGLSRVELWVDGTLSRSVPVEGTSADVRWAWQPPGPGPHTLTVRAMDGAGNVAERSVVFGAGGSENAEAARRERPLFLSPGLRDGINDELVFAPGDADVAVFDRDGRTVYASPAAAPWDAQGVPGGVYVVRVRREGRDVYRALRVVR